MIYDVIVAGAGPAGCTAAYRLAMTGCKVLLIDQAQFPRYKPCGGGLPMHTLAELPFDVTPVLEFTATGAIVTFRGQPALKTPLIGHYAWLADRKKLDEYLLQKACGAGAECITGLRVTSVQEEDRQIRVDAVSRHARQPIEQSFYARWLVGADGVNSITAKCLGLLSKRETGIAMEAEIAVPSAALQEQGLYALFDFGALPHGYGWIFPKKDHLSAGVFQAKNLKAASLKSDLEEFIACQPVLREHEILQVQGHRIPLGGQNDALHTRHSLLVGDAANLADPWLGEGVFYAVRSANLAAEVIRKASENNLSGLSEYTRTVKREILSDFWYARRIAILVYRYPRLATTLISRSALMQDMVFRKVRGDLSFRQLWRRFVIQLPKILLQSKPRR